METTEDQNTSPDSSKHVQDIDVRANPEGALAHFEEQLKTFSEPSFSPEVEAQVRAEAATGKEHNRRQKEALLQEMEIDESTLLLDGGQQNTVKNPTHNQTEPIHNNPHAPSVLGSSAPHELGLQSSQTSTPTAHSSPTDNPVFDLNAIFSTNPPLALQSSGKRTQFTEPPSSDKGSGPQNFLSPKMFNPRSLYDKQILLKRAAQQQHIHRYDLCLLIKSLKKDEDEEVRIQKTLQRFLDTMLRADPSTLIPPYLELDRSDKNVPDLSKEKPVTDLKDYSDLERYFARLSARNPTTGKVYASVILAQNRPFREVLDRTLSSLRNQEISIYTKATDHESPADVGWFLYSTRFQDDERLTELISGSVGEHIGVKWKQIRTTVGYQKLDPANPVKQIKAFHIGGPGDKAHEIRSRLSRWYSSSSSVFLDGTKMRLIPPISNIFSRDGKVKIASLISRQDALNSRLAHATTTEFATNLLLNKPSPHSFKSLRQIMMEIKSSKFPNCSVFHSIDRLYASDRAVCFTYVPENAYDGNKYVAGLIPYLRVIDPWFLSQFTEDARNLHRNNHWNLDTQEVASMEELEMVNKIYGDDELNCSDEPTAI
jgi:hypothetical protein